MIACNRAPLAKKKHRHFGAKHRPKGRTVTGRPWWWVGTDAMMWSRCPKLKKKRLFDSVKQGQERTMQKRTDVSQIFDIFAPKNCDQKVTKFCSEKNLLVGKKKVPPHSTDARVQPFWENVALDSVFLPGTRGRLDTVGDELNHMNTQTYTILCVKSHLLKKFLLAAGGQIAKHQPINICI